MNYELSRIAEKISGRFICVFNSEQKEFQNTAELANSCFANGYIIDSIGAQGDIVVFNLKPWIPPTVDSCDKWANEEKQLNGNVPSFF